jgi:hypothetical protein
MCAARRSFPFLCKGLVRWVFRGSENMSTRSEFLRETLMAGLGIAAAIVLLIGLGLWFAGVFMWLWYARVVLGAAVFAAMAALVVLVRTLPTRTVRSGVAGMRRVDRTQGYVLALLITIVALSLGVCGVLMDWAVELR